MVAKVKKEEVGNLDQTETEVIKVDPIPVQESKKVKIINRNDYDVFIRYFKQEFAVAPQGEVICDELGIPKTLPQGVFKLNV